MLWKARYVVRQKALLLHPPSTALIATTCLHFLALSLHKHKPEICKRVGSLQAPPTCIPLAAICLRKVLGNYFFNDLWASRCPGVNCHVISLAGCIKSCENGPEQCNSHSITGAIPHRLTNLLLDWMMNHYVVLLSAAFKICPPPEKEENKYAPRCHITK